MVSSAAAIVASTERFRCVLKPCLLLMTCATCLSKITFVCLSDRHLWEELLRFSQKCFHASHEKHNKVCAEVFIFQRESWCVLERAGKGAELPFAPCRVVVLDKVTDLLLFFGKLLVVGGVGKKTRSKTGSSRSQSFRWQFHKISDWLRLLRFGQIT